MYAYFDRKHVLLLCKIEDLVKIVDLVCVCVCVCKVEDLVKIFVGVYVSMCKVEDLVKIADLVCVRSRTLLTLSGLQLKSRIFEKNIFLFFESMVQNLSLRKNSAYKLFSTLSYVSLNYEIPVIKHDFGDFKSIYLIDLISKFSKCSNCF